MGDRWTVEPIVDISAFVKGYAAAFPQPLEKFFIIGVRADEEPEDQIAPASTDRTIVLSDSYRPEVFVRREFLES